jgi:hypothetical protein
MEVAKLEHCWKSLLAPKEDVAFASIDLIIWIGPARTDEEISQPIAVYVVRLAE